MAHNRYYIINANDPNCEAIVDLCVGSRTSQRFNIAKTQLVVKLHEGDHNEYEILAPYQEYDHDGILEAIDNDNWQVPPIEPE